MGRHADEGSLWVRVPRHADEGSPVGAGATSALRRCPRVTCLQRLLVLTELGWVLDSCLLLPFPGYPFPYTSSSA